MFLTQQYSLFTTMKNKSSSNVNKTDSLCFKKCSIPGKWDWKISYKTVLSILNIYLNLHFVTFTYKIIFDL